MRGAGKTQVMDEHLGKGKNLHGGRVGAILLKEKQI